LAPNAVLALWTGKTQGDQRPLRDGAAAPVPVPHGLAVRCLKQLHGAGVVAVEAPAVQGVCEAWPAGDGVRSAEGDALVSRGRRSCLVVLSADCATVALASREEVFAAVHVGWRGLVAGVVEATLRAMRALGATGVTAGLGPCIHSCCYRFEAPELEVLARRYGQAVRAITSSGEPALDLPLAVREALSAGGAELVVDLDRCTGCGSDSYSHRARGDERRQALLVWQGPVRR
jgi:copper oxidase (laccase) domain-containing protein